jgi:predicted Zn-dependent protease
MKLHPNQRKGAEFAKNAASTTKLLMLTGFFATSFVAHGQLADIPEEFSWKNPEFVKRFLGSYGVDTEIEPKLSEDDSKVMVSVQQLASEDDMAGAVEVLEKNIKFESSAALDYTLGNFKFQQDKQGEAIQHYVDAVRKFPRFRRAHKNLGLVQVQQGKYQDAIPSIVKSIELGSEGADTYGLLAYCYLNTDKFSSALDAYSRALLYKPTSMDLRQGKAQALLNVEDYKGAIALFDELISEKPDEAQFWGFQANAFLAVEQTENAAANLEIIRRMGQANADQLLLLGDLHMNHNAPFLAVTCYLDAIAQDKKPTFEKALRAGQILASYRHWEDSEKYFKAFQPLYNEEFSDNQKVEILNLEAQIKLGLGQDAEAAAILKKIVISDPLNGRALIQLGQFLIQEAKSLDEEAANLATADAQPKRDQAVELEAEAIGYYESAAKVDKFRVEALTQHAQVLVVRRKEYAAAVKLLEEAQRIKYRENVDSYLTEVRKAAEWQTAKKLEDANETNPDK